MIPFRAIALAILLGAAPASNAGAFLQLPGIQGSSTDEKHKGWIPLESVSFDNSATAASGAGVGKRASHDIRVARAMDQSSPAISQAVTTGRQFSSAEIDFGSERLILKDVIISSVQHTGQSGGGTAMTEHLTLNYASMQIVYPSDSGAKGSPVAATAPHAMMAPAPVAGAHPTSMPGTAMHAAGAATVPVAPSTAATLDAELRPSLSAMAKQWVGTEGRALSQNTGTADQLVVAAHRAALSRFGGIQPNVAGALSFLALMDATKVNHSAQLQAAIQQVMGTTSPAAAGGLTNLK